LTFRTYPDPWSLRIFIKFPNAFTPGFNPRSPDQLSDTLTKQSGY